MAQMAQDGTVIVQKLPEITKENYKELNEKQMALYCHKENVCPMLWQGFLEMPVEYEGAFVRTAKLYVPEDNPTGASFIIMNVPEGHTAVDFICRSGWKDIADREKLPLMVLEPAEGSTWEEPEKERDYILAALAAQRKGMWLNPGFCRYLVGYGRTGTVLLSYAVENPQNTGGAAFVNADDLTAEYLEKTGQMRAMVNGFTFGMQLGEIPTAVMFLSDSEDRIPRNALSFFKAAAAHPRAEERFSEGGPGFFGDIVKTGMAEKSPHASAMTERIWEHIGRYYRYGTGYCSNHIYRRANYEALGVEFRSFTDRLGIDRNFLVYVPERYRGSSKKIPVVISFHGWGNTMRQQFENTLWYELADREGFMVVCPETILYQNPISGPAGAAIVASPKWSFVMGPDALPRDEAYFADLLEILKKDYPTDPGRIYGNGQSMGCAETLFLCQTRTGDAFAAVAACSGLPGLVGFDDRPDPGQVPASFREKVPTFVMMGEYDLWDHHIENPEDNALTLSADCILKRLGLADDENVRDVRINGADSIYVDGRFHNLIWKNEAGVPMFRYAWIEKQCHAITPMESRAAWYEWMCQFTRNPETGKRYYRGVEI